MKTLVWKAIFGGATTGWICAGLGLGIAILGGALMDWSSDSRTAVLSIFGLIGCLLGGFRSGLLERAAPLSNGAIAGILTTAPLALYGLVQNGRVPNFVFAIMLGALMGTFGGIVTKGSSRGNGS
jgi:hypothetical protein